MPRATGATIDLAIAFQPMTDNSAMTMGALGCQRVNGTFEAVKNVLLAIRAQREALVVVIPTNLATSHGISSWVQHAGLM
jgi:hypothetical protein